MLPSDELKIDWDSLPAADREALADILRESIKDTQHDVVNGKIIPALTEEESAAFDDRVIKSVQQGDISSEIIRFGTEGFIKVCAAILHPLISPNKRDHRIQT